MIFHGALSRLKVLVQLRWFMLVLQGAGMYPALALGWLDQRRIDVYVVTIAFAACANACVAFGIRRGGATSSEDAVFAHLALDVLACGVLLLLMGGPWNPLTALFYVYAALGCGLLVAWRREAFLVWILAVIGSLHVVHDLLTPVVPRLLFANPLLLSSQAFVTCLIWVMARYVMRRLQEQSVLVARLGRERERMQNLETISATAAGFAHRLATPLNNAKLRLRRLAAVAPPACDDDLRSARESLAQAEGYLRSIIETSTMYGQARPIRFQTVDIHRFLTRMVSQRDEKDLVFSWDERLPRQLTCTLPVREVEEAFQDLVANATEASQKAVTIHARPGARAGTVDILIRDEGPGFPVLIQERFGEPFLTTKAQGTGLGLYNAKNLFWALGGKLDIGNHEGGALVTVSLPLEGAV